MSRFLGPSNGTAARLARAALVLLALGGSALLAAAAGAAQDHGTWPFEPPVRPPLPAVKNAAWRRNPIDAFVLAKLEERGLAPNVEADRASLLRRVTFDLTGLPPTPAEQAAYLADAAPDAYERLVERLLASPRYGERWAQHWLDVVRFSESDGFKEDALRPAAHRYRDFVIRACNEDVPYNRFIALQIAGDELEPDNPAARVATGFLRLYPDETNAADLRQRRQEILDDITDNTSLALLGVTMGCAQCHDHKFDAILQADYYRLQAFFAGLVPRDDVPLGGPEELAAHERQLAEWQDATADVRRQLDQLVGPGQQAAREDAYLKFDEATQAAFRTPPAERTALQQQLAAQAARYVESKAAEAIGRLKGEAKQQYEELTARLREFDALRPAPLPTAMTVAEAAGPPPPTFRLAGGSFRSPAEELQPGFPQFLGPPDPLIAPPPHAPSSSGRRTALAAWLTRPDHPLTGRIIMNRLWQQLFGLGIVATPNDFGTMGEPPSHAELLDWLAVELVERGWSLKAMHRLLVTSAAYRQSALVEPANPVHELARSVDAENCLLWHARRRRLEGEALRDAMLLVAGQLNERMFGPSARPALPAGLDTRYGWQPDENPADRQRRSIYLLAKRNLRLPLLDFFDLPDRHASCPRRSTTTTPLQTLALLNGELALEQARRWAAELMNTPGVDNGAIVEVAFLQATGRPPDDERRRAALAFIEGQSRLVAAAGTPPEVGLPLLAVGGVAPERASAVVDFCHALLMSNEFLYVD